MITIKENEKFIKLSNCVMALKECKTGYFTKNRKIVLSKLIYLYSNFNKTDELRIHKGKTYHFYFKQSELATEIGTDKSAIGKVMKWLQNEGYITYFSAPKPGNIWKSTFVTMNEKFITEKIGGEYIDNNFIPTDTNVTAEKQLPIIENIPTESQKEIKQAKVFGREELNTHLSNDKIIRFDDIACQGWIAEKPEYSDLVTAIWNYNNTLEQDDYSILKSIFSKIYTGKNEKRIYWTKIEDKINNSWFSQ